MVGRQCVEDAYVGAGWSDVDLGLQLMSAAPSTHKLQAYRQQ